MIFKKINLIIWTFLFSIFAQYLYAQDGIELHVSLASEEISVGDDIELRIDAKVDKDIELKIQDWDERNFPGLSIQDFGRKISKGLFKKTYRWYFVLDTYLSGEYEIAGLAILFKDAQSNDWQTKELNSLFVEVKSLLREGDMDIRDIKEPIGRKSKSFWVMISFVISLIIFLLSILIYFYKRPKKIVEILISPAQEAKTALAKLHESELNNLSELKEFFSQLSFILRRYIERQFAVKAAEMTTEEFLFYVRDADFMVDEYKELLSKFFQLADMVKFARYESDKEEAMQSYDSVLSFVEQTSLKEEIEDDL